MKQLLTLFLVFLTGYITAQTVVTLNVNQPSEFGFEIGVTDSTITNGDSITLGKDLTVFGGSGVYDFSWSPEETLNDPSLMNPIAFPEDTTTYLLTVSDANGCSFAVSYTVNVKKNSTAVTNYIQQNHSLTATLFPNPTDGKFKVQLTGEPQNNIELSVIDNSGKAIKKQVIRNFTGEHTEMLNLKLPSGVYNLLILGKDQRISRTFVIN